MKLKNLATRNDFGKLFQEYYEKGVGAELGVQKGIFSGQILKYWKGKLLCVDMWDNPEDFKEAKKLLLPEAILIKGYSKEIAGTIEDESLDFVYIDADHHYENVKADINSWYCKVRTGGIISGHDYCRYLNHFGVIEAVDEFCKNHGYEIKLTTDDYWEGHSFPSWYFVK